MPLTMPSVDGFNDDTESLGSREVSRLSKDSSKKKKSNSSSLKNIPIIRKSGICQLLAELVRSYSQCARLITEYSFHTGDSELVPEVSIFKKIIFLIIYCIFNCANSSNLYM